MFWQCFVLENIWCGKIVKVKDHVQFYIKFNSESFQICYMASFYHTHQCVGVFKLIYFVIFFIFGVLSLFVLGLGKMVRFLIKFSSEFLHIFYSDSLYHTYQYGGDYKLIYIFNYFLHFCMFFQYFYLEKYCLGNLIRITSNSLHG